ncbi:MAG: hypothetical protein ACOH2V_00700 [Candidatus Saccharimonadaceae bacterium]
MKNQFSTYEIAKKLKELGFDEECLAYYHNDNEDITDNNFYLFDYFNTIGITTTQLKSNKGMECFIAAPLWQQIIDWLFLHLEFYYPYLSLELEIDHSGVWHQSEDEFGNTRINLFFSDRESMILVILPLLDF